MVAFSPNQIKSATDNVGTFDANNNDIRYQFMGEKGAKAADHAEEVTTRLDNLAVAREMEEAKKDAKAIKMATGWERGADGKWRYEIADAKFKLKRKDYSRVGDYDLNEVLDSKELFDAYQSLKKCKVQFLPQRYMHGYLGKAYTSENRILVSSAQTAKEITSTLLHEVQHMIQHKEGFARGGTEKEIMPTKEWKRRISRLEKEIKTLDLELSELESEAMSTPEGVPGLSKEKQDRISELREKIFGLDRKKRHLNEELEPLGYEKYTRLAGEVESRNVEKRLNMSTEERRASLAAETEDVAREDQIFLLDGNEISKPMVRESKRRSAEAEERNKAWHNQDLADPMITGTSTEKAKQERIQELNKIAEDRKKMYDSVLSGNFDGVILQQIDNYIDNVTPNNRYWRPLSQRLPSGVERGVRKGERTSAVDALFSRICEGSVPANERTGADAKRRIEEKKKELLKGWAIATGNWHTDISDFTDSKEPIGSGKDSDVYLSKDGTSVIKASKGKEHLKKFRPDIDAVALFNHLFPNSHYEILGYGEIDGKFVKFLKQPFVDFTNSTPLTVDERVDYMAKLGFKPINKEKTAFSNGTIIAADVQGNNIVRDSADNIRVIDADVKLHTKDIGGEYSYPAVETDTMLRQDNSQENSSRPTSRSIRKKPAPGNAFDQAAAVVQFMKGEKELWEEIRSSYPEAKTDDEIADEVLAHYSGKRGAERLREEQRKIAHGEDTVFEKAQAISALERVRQATKEFWKQVADQVMTDLLDGVNSTEFGTDSRVREMGSRTRGARYSLRSNDKIKERYKLTDKEKDDATKRIDERIAELHRQGENPSHNTVRGNQAEPLSQGKYSPTNVGVLGENPLTAKLPKGFKSAKEIAKKLSDFVLDLPNRKDVNADNFTKKLVESFQNSTSQSSDYTHYIAKNGDRLTIRFLRPQRKCEKHHNYGQEVRCRLFFCCKDT